MKVDLHTHSRCSDGSLTPVELVEQARQAGVTLLSITDHDRVDAYRALEVPDSLRLVEGIEISTQWRHITIHVLGLGINAEADSIRQLVRRQEAARRARLGRIVKRLERSGLQVDLDDFLARHQGAMLGRPQLAAYLVKTGQVSSEQKAFQKHLGQGKAGDVHQVWPDLDEVAKVTQRAGGVVVLAHPLKYRLTRSRLRELLADFAAAGGQAMEVICGPQTLQATRDLAALCREFNLHASMGSDFHGAGRGVARPGVEQSLPANLRPVWELFAP